MKVFVAGGTSGIGLELASKYIKRGDVVAICGRDISKISESIRPHLKVYEVDIRNKELLNAAVADFAQEGLDLLIISAGYYADDSLHEITYLESSDILSTNIAGVVNAFEAGREAMLEKQSGRIVVLASISALLNYKNATTYSKTKRAVMQIADAYRRGLKSFGVRVTVVAPGYVNTARLRELNKEDLSKKPFVVSTAEAAEIIVKGIDRDEETIVFPEKMKYLMKYISLFPSCIQGLIMYRKAKWMSQK